MKLLDPLGGFLVTSGSGFIHILLFITYLVLKIDSFKIEFLSEDNWVYDYS
jgi:hypothetical protein